MTLAEQIEKLGETALEIKAQRDRYEKALREIAKGRENDGCAYCGEQDEDDHTADCPTMIAQEALQCE